MRLKGYGPTLWRWTVEGYEIILMDV
jgi:hypothetical protein